MAAGKSSELECWVSFSCFTRKCSFSLRLLFLQFRWRRRMLNFPYKIIWLIHPMVKYTPFFLPRGKCISCWGKVSFSVFDFASSYRSVVTVHPRTATFTIRKNNPVTTKNNNNSLMLVHSLAQRGKLTALQKKLM